MNEIIEEFKAIELSRMQKFLAILTIVLLILANTNIKPSEYPAYVREGSAINLYFATVFTSGDAVSLGIFGQFIRIK